MRRSDFGLVTLLGLAQGSVFAQAPPTNPAGRLGQPQSAPVRDDLPPPPVMTADQQKLLDTILTTWETDAKGLQSIAVQFLISQQDNTAFKGVVDKSWGEAKVLRLPTGA